MNNEDLKQAYDKATELLRKVDLAFLRLEPLPLYETVLSLLDSFYLDRYSAMYCYYHKPDMDNREKIVLFENTCSTAQRLGLTHEYNYLESYIIKLIANQNTQL